MSRLPHARRRAAPLPTTPDHSLSSNTAHSPAIKPSVSMPASAPAAVPSEEGPSRIEVAAGPRCYTAYLMATSPTAATVQLAATARAAPSQIVTPALLLQTPAQC